MKMKSLFAFSIVVLLSACANVDIGGNSIPADIVDETADAALLVGVIGFKKPGSDQSPNSYNAVQFRKKDSDLIGNISVSNGPMEPHNDYREEDWVRKVFAIPLKAGEYEIANAVFYFNNGVFEQTISSRKGYSVPFTLEKGKVHYLGEFVAHSVYGRKPWLGKSPPIGGYFVYSSALERNREIILERYPDLVDRPMENLDLDLNLPPLLIPEKSYNAEAQTTGKVK